MRLDALIVVYISEYGTSAKSRATHRLTLMLMTKEYTPPPQGRIDFYIGSIKESSLSIEIAVITALETAVAAVPIE